MKYTAQPILQARANLGEGAIWDSESSVLYWIDINNKLLHCYDPAQGKDGAVDLGDKPGCVVRRAEQYGGFILGLPGKFVSIENQEFVPDKISEVKPVVIASMEEGIKTNRMNDGKCDPAGRFWCGSMVTDFSHAGGNLWMMDRNHKLHLKLSNVTISNGIMWNSTHDTMYYIDTKTNKVDAFDYDNNNGDIANRRTVVANAWGGHFDGMTIDSDDNIYVAIWEGSAVRKFNPKTGELLATIEVPGVKNVTSCAFGGINLQDLYITSSAENAELALEPNAGALFKIHLSDCRGVVANQYLG